MTKTITIAEAARRLNRSPRTVRKWMDNGDLLFVIPPGCRRCIEEREIERFFATWERGKVEKTGITGVSKTAP